MVANDDLEGKTTYFTGFYTHTISEPKISKPPIVTIQGRQLSCKMQCKCAGEKKVFFRNDFIKLCYILRFCQKRFFVRVRDNKSLLRIDTHLLLIFVSCQDMCK